MASIQICYLCNVTLNSDNRSFEHIIPNCIGGIEGSYDLLCRNCNTQLGLEIEGDFAKSLNPICALLQIKRDRNKIPHIKNLTDGLGNLYHLENGRKPVRVKPTILKHDNGYFISAKDRKEAYHIISKIKAKEPLLDTENLEQKFIESKSRLHESLHFDLKVGGELFFRTVAKIAVNTFVFLGGERRYITNAIQYIVTGKSEIPEFIHYHVEPNETMSLAPSEVCHCIYIKGDMKTKLLFAYIELFNAISFVVKLSDNFDGKDFEENYCIDLLEGRRTYKSISVKYPDGASPNGYSAYDPIFFPVMQSKLSRLVKISHIRQAQITFKEELELLWSECQNNYNNDPINNRNQSKLFLENVANLLSDLGV